MKTVRVIKYVYVIKQSVIAIKLVIKTIKKARFHNLFIVTIFHEFVRRHTCDSIT